MVGIAGSGKTTFCKKLFPSHVHISLDEIDNKNRKKEYELIEQNLQQGKSIVIDDTNLTKHIRKEHILRARRYNARVVVVFLDYTIERILLQNSKREKQVPHHVISKMRRELETPSDDEGFDYLQVIRDNFSL